MNERSMTCAETDELLLDYFEGTLEAGSRARVELHASSCARCSRLIRDVTGIRDEAGALADLMPRRDLWQGIEARIQPGVVPIGFARRVPAIPRMWLAAAAAALVVATAGVTYFATARLLMEQGAASLMVASAAKGPTATRPEVDSPAESVAARVGRGEVFARGSVRGTGRTGTPLRASLASTSGTAPLTQSELALSGEIRRLQEVLVQRRTQLDPATVRVVEDNLRLIDAAVRQAREALGRDPASGFLADQLDSVLEKKVDLLRTVALLPSRT